jgi:hypothetical protein
MCCAAAPHMPLKMSVILKLIMSIRTLLILLKRPVLNIGPAIWTDKNCLYARTSKIFRLLSLFSYSKLVIVNRQKKHIEISITTVWFYKKKQYIQFSDIEYLDISEREIINDPGLSIDPIEKTGFGGRDPTQIYYVQVRTKSSPIPVNLFRFVDEGSWNLGGIGIFFKDSCIEQEGLQKKKANSYAELLSNYIGAKLWRDRNVQFRFDPNNLRKCTKCGHQISLSAESCTYCGFKDSS